MIPNVGSLDRVLRILLGCVLLFTGYYFKNWFGLIGIVPLLTATFRFCPAYMPFGINTCALDKKD